MSQFVRDLPNRPIMIEGYSTRGAPMSATCGRASARRQSKNTCKPSFIWMAS
ncbi:MAG TPA: hypothetical protein VG672_17095 [Bryobacteraceae bacterium]|jgi:hypothetical protein|nr:hypothetical protein [Bryobacteraceae bacterium]